MWLSRLLVLLLAALTLAACARQPRQAVVRTNDIDALMYGGATVPASRTVAARVIQATPVSEVIGGAPYTLDSGDKLRIVVFGQDTLSNTYTLSLIHI